MISRKIHSIVNLDRDAISDTSSGSLHLQCEDVLFNSYIYNELKKPSSTYKQDEASLILDSDHKIERMCQLLDQGIMLR